MTSAGGTFAKATGAILLACLLAGSLHGAICQVLIGTRKDGPGRGISIADFNLETGALSAPRLVCETPQPVYWVGDPTGSRIYFCHGLDQFGDTAEGFVSAFAYDRVRNSLTLLNQAAIGGRGASHVNLDHSGRWLLEASYRSGHVAVFALQADGSIGARTATVAHSGRSVHPERQTSPHPHSIYPDPTNRFLVVPDLGTDKIVVYRFDADQGVITPHAPPSLELPPGSGPRHLAWHPDGRRAYVTLELVNAVAAMTWDSAAGTLTLDQSISTLAPGFSGANTAAEIAVHPSGRYVYASNRGADNSIAAFTIDATSGKLAPLARVSSRGLLPRNFTIDRSGRWMVVSNHDSDSLVVFAIDPTTGGLAPVGEPVTVPNPFGTRFLEAPAQP